MHQLVTTSLLHVAASESFVVQATHLRGAGVAATRGRVSSAHRRSSAGVLTRVGEVAVATLEIPNARSLRAEEECLAEVGGSE